ncbi:cytoplasmic tRNA 2-thiolation protein 2 [Polyplosphaeria fusca]|uniref:Cytoplasmic tRNA 2-thiolation protein 2 n=1 Tax=Polyplosphaeria fusca TaxID=682080 RepID=A0A9P4UWM5_9PLEO|nr:cytoplasmic tRNA 2-thiolation protein 2 [Polyplosphaeria fusca]
MPGKHLDEDQLCARCGDNVSVLTVRSEPLCRDCFLRYVHTKVIKRMESFRVRNAASDRPRKVLVPVSFGVSSVSLLHILDHHLKTQLAKTGRTGFDIVVAFVDSSAIETSPDPELRASLRDRYINHECQLLPLASIFDTDAGSTILGEYIPNMDSVEPSNPEEKLAALINSLDSATARADVQSTLRTRLLVQHAKSMDCEAILWGDSTTRLAEKTLSETAKGRGFSLPWVTGDGDSPLGITYHFPMRDLLKKELVSYAAMTDPPLTELIHSRVVTQSSTSSKNTTIDELMAQYFDSVEENFPSIVSNVVRTAGKLSTPSISGSPCGLCGNLAQPGRFGIEGWGGTQQKDSSTSNTSNLCYGCTRSLPKS